MQVTYKKGENMCALYEYAIMRSTGKLRFARGTHENLIYLPGPPAVAKQGHQKAFILFCRLSFLNPTYELNPVHPVILSKKSDRITGYHKRKPTIIRIAAS
jgi:hypothetical protein